MSRYTAKVRPLAKITGFLKERSVDAPRFLSPLLNSYWKPASADLKDFPPSEKVIRLRAEKNDQNRAKVEELATSINKSGYAESRKLLCQGGLPECEKWLKENGYEKWGEEEESALEFIVSLPNGRKIIVLEETFDGQLAYFKFEAESEAEIQEMMELLGLAEKDLLLKNRAELFLAER